MFGGSRLHSGVGVGGRIGLVRFGGVALAFSVTVLLVVVGVQPRLWSTVLSRRGGSGLFDVPYLVSRRVDISSRVVGGVVYGSVDPVVRSAVRNASVKPQGSLDVTLRPLYASGSVGGEISPGRVVRIAIGIPEYRHGLMIPTVLRVLVLESISHHVGASRRTLSMMVNGCVVPPYSVSEAVKQWKFVSYLLKGRCFSPGSTNGSIKLAIVTPPGAYLNSSPAGWPWIQVSANQGFLYSSNVRFAYRWKFDTQVGTGVQRVIVPSSIVLKDQPIVIPGLLEMVASVHDVSLFWPDWLVAFETLNLFAIGLALSYVVLLGLCCVGVVRLLRPPAC